ISFSGYCEGNKVKIYEAHSKEQIKLRLYVQNDNNLKEYFPSIIAYNDRYIVEEWVSIDKEKDNLEDKQAQVFKILSILHSTNLPKDIRGGFCYLFDYLLPRVEKWSVFQKVEDFVKDWNDEFLKNSHNIESKIS